MYSGGVLVPSAVLFETPEQIFLRVFAELKPRTQVPTVRIEFRQFANANSFIRWDEAGLQVRITDVLKGAPAPILEALAYILLSKLVRRTVPKMYADRYRRYLNRKDMRRTLQLVKQARGRKFVSGPRGSTYDLEEIFEELNRRHFEGWMAQPLLGWSRRPSRVMLGHYDPSHHAIILSRLLDHPDVPRVVVEYVLFHEMLHLRFPVEHRGVRCKVHTREFKAAEKEFPDLKQAQELLKRICA